MAERLAALDTEVLLAIEAGAEDCITAQSLLRSVGFLFRATPTVIQELEKAQYDTRREFTAALAQNIFRPGVLQALGVVSARMNDTERDVTEIHARTVMEKNMLEGVKHSNEGDIFALIEAAYADCVFFITTNAELLDRSDPLSLALIQICGMRALLIVSPDEIIEAFKTAS